MPRRGARLPGRAQPRPSAPSAPRRDATPRRPGARRIRSSPTRWDAARSDADCRRIWRRGWPRGSRARPTPRASTRRGDPAPPAKLAPFLVGGSADLAGSTTPPIKASGDVGPAAARARIPSPGATSTSACASTRWARSPTASRSTAPSVPYCGTFLIFSDYMRPSIRLAALMKLRVDLRLHPRLDLRRRGRPDPPADRAARRAARDPGPHGVPAGRRRRDGDGLGLGAAARRGAGGARARRRQTLPALKREAPFALRGRLAGRLRGARARG